MNLYNNLTIINENIIFDFNKLNTGKMKNFILVLISVIFLCGCSENPINNNGYVSDSIDVLNFNVYQEFNGRNVSLLNDILKEGKLYNNTFMTLDNGNIYFIYSITGDYSFTLTINGINYQLKNDGLIELNLNSNTNYNILIQ